MRIGHGYDVHAFGEGSALILGGVMLLNWGESVFPISGLLLLIPMGMYLFTP